MSTHALLPEPADVDTRREAEALADFSERAQRTCAPHGGYIARQIEDRAHAYRCRAAALVAHQMGGEVA